MVAPFSVCPLLHFEDVESELDRSWDALHGEYSQDWEEARDAARDAWQRARERRK